MTAQNNDTLPYLKLATVQQSQCQFVILDDLPLISVAVGDFAEKAGIALRHWKMHVDPQSDAEMREFRLRVSSGPSQSYQLKGR